MSDAPRTDQILSKIETGTAGVNAYETIWHYDGFGRKILQQQQTMAGSNTTIVDASTFTYQPQLDTTRLLTASNQTEMLTFQTETAPPFAGIGYSVAATNSANPLGLIQDTYTVARDVTGNISQITNSESQILYTKQYDPAGRLIAAETGSQLFSSNSPVLKAALEYDSFGRKSKISFSDALTGSILYDQMNRISEMHWMKGQSKLQDEIPSYDSVGNITHIARDNGFSDYAYDSANQLLSTQSQSLGGLPNYDRKDVYDFAGNRVQDSKNGAAQVIANFVTSDTKHQYAADSNGYGDVAKILNKETNQAELLSYRSDGRLTSFSKDPSNSGNITQQVQYFQDALGRRVAKQVYALNSTGALSPQFAQTFGYLLTEDRILLATSGDGNVSLYVDGKGVDEHIGEATAKEAKGYATDHLGSVINSPLTDGAKQFGSWGERLAEKAEIALGLTANSTPVVYGFTGRQFDTESGFYYFRARTFDSTTGRFLQLDPIGLRSGANQYQYTSNQPVLYTDPNGECPFLATAAIGGFFGGLSAFAVGAYQGQSGNQLLGTTIAGAATGFALGSGYGLLAYGAELAGVGVAGQIFSGTVGSLSIGTSAALTSQALITGNVNVEGTFAAAVAGSIFSGAFGSLGSGLPFDLTSGLTQLPVDIGLGVTTSSPSPDTYTLGDFDLSSGSV